MPKVTTLGSWAPPAAEPLDGIQAALQVVARAITQVRAHERLLAAAGVRLDRAGAALLYHLHQHGAPMRVTSLAERLGIDAPSVTRKVQQLEREGLVARRPDPDDRRATRIGLTSAGRRTLARVLRARREWYERLFDGWSHADMVRFSGLLGRFASALENDMGTGGEY